MKKHTMRSARRISQIVFLGLFLYLFFQARFPYEDHFLPSDLFLRASPLVGLTAMIASRTFISTLVLSLIVLALTIPLGRFFCGWICPLGTVIDGSDNLIRRRKRKPRERETLRFRFWKFAILVGVFIAAVFSLQFIWLFDPIALFTRTMTVVIFPVFVFMVNAIFTALFDLGILEDQVYSVFDFAQSTFLPIDQPKFYESMLVLLMFLGILSMGLFARRFWCRNLCPLGALLGIFSKYRLTKRYVSEACNQCTICQRDCKMNAIEDDYTVNNTVECIECAECVAVCKPRAVSYTFGKNPGKNEIDLSRRRFIQASAAGVVVLAAVKTAAIDRSKAGHAIRPPGSLAEDIFLDRCIRCQQCVRICASTGGCLQPSLTESGLEGFWSPVAVARLGYCEYNCNLCGQVCPTGAIRNLPLEQKKEIKMGLAFFDKSRCIPWYKQEDCLVCEEHCPVPEKAIKFDVREARAPDGTIRLVKFPFVVEERCTGCCICETKCPVIGKPGIFITTAQEMRVEPANEQESQEL